jgi:hypothetical protein
MAEDQQPDRRVTLLAFLERHWSELSLQDARSLSVELIENIGEGPPMIKETLTYS